MTSKSAAVVDTLLKEKITVQQLRSFDDYIANQITAIIETSSEVKCQSNLNDGPVHTLKFKNPNFGPPCLVERDGETRQITPTIARLRDLTFSSPLYIDVVHTIQHSNNPSDTETKTHERLFLARIPVMVGANIHTSAPRVEGTDFECPYDSCGYFIINGNEKFLPAQERICCNKIMAFESKSRGLECVMYSQLNPLTQANATIKLTIKKNDVIMDFPHVEGVRVCDVLSAIGMSDKDFIIDFVSRHDDRESHLKLKYLARVAMCDQLSQRDAIVLLESKCVRWKEYLYPHDKANRQQLLCDQFKMLLFTHFKLREPDSRDALKNKRIDSCGTLLTVLTAQLWNQYLYHIKQAMQTLLNQKRQVRAQRLVRSSSITEGLKFSLATGRFVIKETSKKKSEPHGKARTGVAQALGRHNFISSVSQLRRIDSSVSHDSKSVECRLLRSDCWGFICPSQTPEGSACGLVSNMAIAARISVSSPIKVIMQLISPFVSQDLSTRGKSVYVNGVFAGIAKDPTQFVKEMRHHRSSRVIAYDVTIANEDSRVSIWSDSGRIVRPVFVLNNGMCGLTDKIVKDLRAERIKFDDLLSLGVVEFIDPLETEKLLIALKEEDITPKHTHMEISPHLILGTMVSTIPFSDHNQSPRNTYQAAMGKQAVGLYATNYQHRMDTLANVLNYNQKPLVTTDISEKLHVSELPAGVNAIVAVSLYNGYNQEDSILVNRGSIDRGFMRATGMRTYSSSDVNKGQARHKFKCDGSAHIDDDGLPRKGATLRRGSTVIGRSVGERDASLKNAKGKAVVDRVFKVQNDQGGTTCKVRLREDRIMTIGDKLASRHGQKGTCGMILNEEDMPFTVRDGIRPDLIISPHCLPSRMTVAHIIESLASKIAVFKGIRVDATAFNHTSVYDFQEQLKAMGFECTGSERMMRGDTGEMMEGKIFICPVFYQRLKHFAGDKESGRAKGHVSALTRQPIGGRKYQGGLRFGEMERDAVLGSGAPEVLRERMMISSDKFDTEICRNCGIFGTKKKVGGRVFCHKCNQCVFTPVSVPYATKQMTQELLSMGIDVKLHIGASPHDPSSAGRRAEPF